MRKNDNLESKFGWYRRYRDKINKKENINENDYESNNDLNEEIIGDFFQ